MQDDPFENLVSKLLSEYQQRVDAGETQIEAVAAETILPDAVRERIEQGKACIDLLMALKRAATPPPARFVNGLGAASQALYRTDQLSRRKIGRFTILEELGSGGFGIVYRAEDPGTKREVALKIPRFEALVSGELKLRFEREAHAAAKLDHPHIVSVLEAGTDGMLPYIVSVYYRGITLTNWLRQPRDPIRPQVIAEFVQKLAAALAHAHERGVLHRDIKPSNILVVPPAGAPMGKFRLEDATPKLMDFGLAKLADAARDMTQTGALLGTVRYMSPEQAAGQAKQIGAASDVYSLGTVLYELLAGEPPFAAESDLEVLRRIATQEPSRIRAGRPATPRDLETICLKCLEKEPRRRYRSAQELAEDLSRFLTGLPIQARSSTRLELMSKWARRNPALAGLISLAGLATALFVIGMIWSNAKISSALHATEEQRELATRSAELASKRERKARRYAYNADMRLANQAWDNGSSAEAQHLLTKYIPHAADEELRGMEWRCLKDIFDRSSRVVATQPTFVWSLAVAPNNELFATGDPQGVVRLWRLEPPELVRELRHEGGNIDALVFTPDSRSLISSGDDHTIRFWNVATGQSLHVLREHTDWVGTLDISRDGRLLASGGGEGRVLLWDLATAELTKELARHPKAVRWVAFHPKKTLIASASEDGEVRLWDYVESRVPPEVIGGKLEGRDNASWRNAVWDAAGDTLWAPERQHLVGWQITGFDDWSRIRREVDEKCLIKSIGWLSSDFLIEGMDEPPIIRVRSQNAENKGNVVRTLHGHSDGIRCLAALVDGDSFLSGSEDGTVRRWQLTIRDQSQATIDLPESASSVDWSPKGDEIVVGMRGDGRVLLVDPLLRRPHRLLCTMSHPPTNVFFAHHMGRILVVDAVEGLHWIDAERGTASKAIPTEYHSDEGYLDPSDEYLAFVRRRQLTVISTADGRTRWQHTHPLDLAAGLLLDDRVVTGSDDGIVRVFDIRHGTLLRQTPPQRGPLLSVQRSQDGKRLITSSRDRTVRIYDAETLTEQVRFALPRPPIKAFFIDQDRRILLAHPHEIDILDPENGEAMFNFVIPSLAASNARVSSDGAILLSAPVGALKILPLCFELPNGWHPQ